MKKLLYIFVFLIYGLGIHETKAQKAEWAKNFYVQENNLFPFLVTETQDFHVINSVTDDRGNSYLLTEATGFKNGSDNIQYVLNFNQIKIQLTKFGLKKHVNLIKIDSSGRSLKSNHLNIPLYQTSWDFKYNTKAFTHPFLNFTLDDSAYLYNTSIFDSSLLNHGSSLYYYYTSNCYSGSFNSFQNTRTIFYNKKLYFIGETLGCDLIVGNDIYNLNPSKRFSNGDSYSYSHFNYILGELDPMTGVVLWSESIHNNDSNNRINVKDFKVIDDKIYVAGDYKGTVYIGNDTLDGIGACILQFNDTGGYQKNHHFGNGKTTINTLTTVGNNLYFSGNFNDTLNWSGNTNNPQFKNRNEIYFASLDKDLNQRWFYHPTEKINRSGKIDLSLSDKGFLYFAGHIYNEIDFQGIKVGTNLKGNQADTNAFYMKMDTLGNMLWAENIPYRASIRAFSGSAETGFYISGEVPDSLVLANDTIVSKGINTDIYFAKIMDYTITRGDVLAGPYCAGDTIKVPYTKTGTFDATNEFIAELSDEEGKFDSLSFELGRIKSTKADTIKGFLPLFDVSTSGKYRIRVRSTAPKVTSYFILDTLKLLIYSKDTANAGIDRTICKGDSVELKTFGGTQWQWTPGNLTKDSAFWRTFAYPDSTTEFRIIIRDSSGCGVTDTDFVVINVREKLEIKTPFYDTAICENQSIEFVANTFGGDTNNHVVNWYEMRKDSLIKLDSNTKKITVICDSFCKAQTELRDTGKVILAILWDSCTAIKDTQIYYLNATKNLDVKVFSDKEKTIEFNDTTLCLGQTITLYPKGFGGNSSSYGYEWWVGGFEFSNADSATITSTKNEEYFVVLKDGCSPLNDTFFFKININPALNSEIINQNNKATFPKDTTICFGQTIKLISKNSGGDSTKYGFEWWVGGFELSNVDTFEYTFLEENTSQKIQLILTDNCTLKGDTNEINIFTKAKLKLEATVKDTFCLDENYIVKTNASGGDSTKYGYEWWVGGNQFSNADSAKIPTNNIGNNTLKIVLKDGCSAPNDSIIKDYFVRDALKINVNIADTFCAGTTINATASASGGNPGKYSFEWWVGGIEFSPAGAGQNLSYKISQNEEGKLNEIKVKISDNCSNPALAGQIFIKNIFVTNPLKVSLTIDSNCVNNKAKITANTIGGKESDYNFEWFVNDVFSQNNSTGIFNFADNKDAKIKVKVDDNCSQKQDSTEVILQALIPKISIEINPKDDCEPLEVFLKITNENGTKNSYNWSVGNGEILNNISADSATYIYNNSGTFIGYIKAKTNNNCEADFVQQTVFVRPLPTVDFTWNPTEIYLSQPEVNFQNLSSQNDKFNWQINDSNFSKDFNIKYIFNDSGFYTIKLIAENEFKCFDSSIKLLFVKDLVSVFIPNVFTPNGDDLNDEFTPIVTGIESYEIQVYNRWGQQIFEGNMNQHWNGKYNNTNVPDGTYLYQIRLLRTDKKVVYLNGSLQILR